jgi:hypothetical protein
VTPGQNRRDIFDYGKKESPGQCLSCWSFFSADLSQQDNISPKNRFLEKRKFLNFVFSKGRLKLNILIGESKEHVFFYNRKQLEYPFYY